MKDKPDTKKKDTKKKDAKKKDSKPDTKVKDKPDTKKKDAKKKDSKPDTKVKDKPDTKNKDAKKKDSKPDTKLKDKPDSEVKDKPDTKVKDKEDIESSASKKRAPKTLSNGEPTKIFDSIKEILKCFVCEKFMNEKFSIRGFRKDEITLCVTNKPKKGSKITHAISTYRDKLLLNIEKVTNSMKEDRSIYSEDKKICKNNM